MSRWMILGAVLIAVGVAMRVAAGKRWGSWMQTAYIFPIIVAICIFLFCPMVRLCENTKIDSYIRQKAYIESHIAENTIEDAALTSKKIELTDWLFEAQSSKMRLGNWSLYPDAVMDLTPIE